MKKILVIGGSHGIGDAVVRQLRDDHEVIILSRTAPEPHEQVTHHTIDITTDSPLPVIDVLDGLVYCPGSINLKPFTQLKEADFRTDFEINVMGAVRVLHHYVKALKAGDSSSVVLFSTAATKLGMPFHSSVAASKSAVEGLMKSLAAEYTTSIRFNAIGPTVTDTPLAARLLRSDKQRDMMAERHPLKRYLQSDEVAQMVTYLLSPASSAISGQVLYLDAGIGHLKV